MKPFNDTTEKNSVSESICLARGIETWILASFKKIETNQPTNNKRNPQKNSEITAEKFLCWLENRLFLFYSQSGLCCLEKYDDF